MQGREEWTFEEQRLQAGWPQAKSVSNKGKAVFILTLTSFDTGSAVDSAKSQQDMNHSYSGSSVDNAFRRKRNSWQSLYAG